MPTKLEKTVKREIEIDGQAYTVAISPDGVKLTQKGYRKGRELTWKELKDQGEAGEAGAANSSGAADRWASSGSENESRPGLGSPESGYR
jgi:hypothetical protein